MMKCRQAIRTIVGAIDVLVAVASARVADNERKAYRVGIRRCAFERLWEIGKMPGVPVVFGNLLINM